MKSPTWTEGMPGEAKRLNRHPTSRKVVPLHPLPRHRLVEAKRLKPAVIQHAGGAQIWSLVTDVPGGTRGTTRKTPTIGRRLTSVASSDYLGPLGRGPSGSPSASFMLGGGMLPSMS